MSIELFSILQFSYLGFGSWDLLKIKNSCRAEDTVSEFSRNLVPS